MTPQLVPPPDAGQGGAHLTGEQFGELLSRFTETPEGELTPAEVHLRACEVCSTELANLRAAILLFRTGTAWDTTMEVSTASIAPELYPCLLDGSGRHVRDRAIPLAGNAPARTSDIVGGGDERFDQ